MTNFDEFPHSLITNIKGEASVIGGGRVKWWAGSDGLLHVMHLPNYGESTTTLYGLTPARKTWVAVEES
jgi:hypothetical protein